MSNTDYEKVVADSRHFNVQPCHTLRGSYGIKPSRQACGGTVWDTYVCQRVAEEDRDIIVRDTGQRGVVRGVELANRAGGSKKSANPQG